MSSRFHGETNTIPEVLFSMVRPLVLVVRETPSLADSVQILLETVGFRVVSFGSLSSALDRIEDRAAESFPAEARDVPLLVVGQRALQGGRKWPANVRSIGLPLDSGALVTALAHLTGIEAAGPPAS